MRPFSGPVKYIIAAARLNLALVIVATVTRQVPVKEYAQYKDLAGYPEGQQRLAYDYCGAEIGLEGANAQAQLAVQYGALGRLQQAHADGDSCLAVMSKTRDALKAVRAEAWIEFAYRHCKGERPPTK